MVADYTMAIPRRFGEIQMDSFNAMSRSAKLSNPASKEERGKRYDDQNFGTDDFKNHSLKYARTSLEWKVRGKSLENIH